MIVIIHSCDRFVIFTDYIGDRNYKEGERYSGTICFFGLMMWDKRTCQVEPEKSQRDMLTGPSDVLIVFTN